MNDYDGDDIDWFNPETGEWDLDEPVLATFDENGNRIHE